MDWNSETVIVVYSCSKKRQNYPFEAGVENEKLVGYCHSICKDDFNR